MNIILIPDNTRKGRIASFARHHVLLMILTGVVFLPTLFGVLAYQVNKFIDNGSLVDRGERIAIQQAELRNQRIDIQRARARTEAHLNVLAQRLGQLQAQVLRLNALGSRLTHMAGISTREFNFAEPVALGGPADPAAASATDDGQLLLALDSLNRQVDQQTDKLVALERLLDASGLAEIDIPHGWPTQGGWISSYFGERVDPFTGKRSVHHGIDIASPLGSPVRTLGAGVVSYAGNKIGYGVMVEINHGNGYVTRYSHATTTLVNTGDRVAKGQAIATVGSSGRSTGPHLHLEVLKDRIPVNPLSFLTQSGGIASATATPTPQ